MNMHALLLDFLIIISCLFNACVTWEKWNSIHFMDHLCNHTHTQKVTERQEEWSMKKTEGWDSHMRTGRKGKGKEREAFIEGHLSSAWSYALSLRLSGNKETLCLPLIRCKYTIALKKSHAKTHCIWHQKLFRFEFHWSKTAKSVPLNVTFCFHGHSRHFTVIS